MNLFAAAILLALAADPASDAKDNSAPIPFRIPDDLKFELLLKEPDVRQPVHLSFDERGRLWVVQFLQYPAPAGLKPLSHDSYWRAQYDKVPPPPPNHFVGEDKITIHEDTDGDGQFDKQKTFVEGLNIVTAVCRGRGGVWMTNPPYLLFYPDRNNDDVPDGDPEVHLEGFGLEDTHSVVNSLCWGPDGWLYAAQGSTVTGQVKHYGVDEKPVHSLGQHIWRYHPETKRYEIFSEGGGNAFGVEVDSAGRVFSGYNGGDTRGFHYVQGGYLQKGFNKHGPLSNPYSFGYFPPMAHNQVQRFTHTFAIYEGNTLPEQYHGTLFGVSPLLHHVVMSKFEPDHSTFKSQDIGHAVATDDPRFIPVDIKLGSDGALYVADWYDNQCAHTKNQEGQIDKSDGRIYRLTAKDAGPQKPEDLSKLSSAQLVERLKHPNKWQRQVALRLLADRRDEQVVPTLRKLLVDDHGQLALESLWAINLCGGLDEATALTALDHTNPQVRLWTVRLLCDEKKVSSPILARLIKLAESEPNVEVRSQLACSARRLPVADDLAIVRKLLAHAEDADEPRLPLLLWWAIEAKVNSDPNSPLSSPRGEGPGVRGVIDLFRDPEIWKLPIVERHLTERLMRRFAATGSRKDLLVCAELLKLAPRPDDVKRLMTGFETAYSGRPLTNLPDELATALAAYSSQSTSLGLRQGRKEAVDDALQTLADAKADRSKQIQYVQILGEVSQPRCVPSLTKLATASVDGALQAIALGSLARYDDPSIAPAVLGAYNGMTDDVRSAAEALLVSRSASALAFLKAIDAKQIDATRVPNDVVQRLTRFKDPEITELVRRHWGEMKPLATAEARAEITRIATLLRSGEGVPKLGKPLYMNSCGKCHQLFGEGGKVGPDLTSYNRDDLDRMLLNVVNPSAEIREGFGTVTVVTSDGRVLSGILAEQDSQVVVLRTTETAELPIPRSDIEEITASPQSIMPEGLLKQYNEEQLRHLFGYLRMTQPLIDK